MTGPATPTVTYTVLPVWDGSVGTACVLSNSKCVLSNSKDSTISKHKIIQITLFLEGVKVS